MGSVINRLLCQYLYVCIRCIKPLLSLNLERVPLPTQRNQLDSLEQLPLSLCTYPFPLDSSSRTTCFLKTRIWLRIALF